MKTFDTANLHSDIPLSEDLNYWIYNGLDCTVTHEICSVLLDLLDPVTTKTYQRSIALQGPILDLTMRGIRVDFRRRAQVLTLIESKISQLETQLTTIVNDGIGFPVALGGKTKWWRSTTRLKTLFYEVLNIPPIKKRNAQGFYTLTINEAALEKISFNLHAEILCSHLLALRELDKKRSFLETAIDPDGRIRTSINIAGTTTGRLSSSMSDFGTGTNLQNVDRELREIFIPDDGMKFGNVDLEQADSRNLGAVCWTLFLQSHGELFAGSYLNACESGDLHTFVSKMARPQLPWTNDSVKDRAIADTKYHRQNSYRDLDKKLGHGTNYLGEPNTMARHSRVPKTEVETFQRNYFAAFGCIKEYHNYVATELKRVGQLTTLYGRRRRFFGRPDDKAVIREAVAYVPQSMTGEEINDGLLNLWRKNYVQLLIQVHDSILFQYPENQEADIIQRVLEDVKTSITLPGNRVFSVPVDCKVGWNWGDVGKDGSNEFGLKKWKGSDDRVNKKKSSFLD